MPADQQQNGQAPFHSASGPSFPVGITASVSSRPVSAVASSPAVGTTLSSSPLVGEWYTPLADNSHQLPGAAGAAAVTDNSGTVASGAAAFGSRATGDLEAHSFSVAAGNNLGDPDSRRDQLDYIRQLEVENRYLRACVLAQQQQLIAAGLTVVGGSTGSALPAEPTPGAPLLAVGGTQQSAGPQASSALFFPPQDSQLSCNPRATFSTTPPGTHSAMSAPILGSSSPVHAAAVRQPAHQQSSASQGGMSASAAPFWPTCQVPQQEPAGDGLPYHGVVESLLSTS